MPTNTDSLLSPEKMEQIRIRIWDKVRQLAPSHLAPFIPSDTVSLEPRKDGWSVLVRLIPKKGLTEDIRAQEYGSGLHATRKFHSKHQLDDGRILIKPKPPKTLLTFYWERLGKTVRREQVKHPGIKPYRGKGFVRESLVQSEDAIVKELGPEVAKQLHLKVRAIFSRPGGKNK